MEVHPPDHLVMTFRQFVVHMAIVVLGLLIAIGLEQSVEWLHHRHQRHQLEEDLRAEAVGNLHTAIQALEFCDAMTRWQFQQIGELDRAAAERRTPAFIPRPAMAHYSRPSDAVWNVAASGSTLALLPRSEAVRFAHLYFDVTMATERIKQLNDLQQQRLGVLDAASASHTGPLLIQLDESYDLSRLNSQELARLRDIDENIIVSARAQASYFLTFYALTWGTLHGYSDDQSVNRRNEVYAAYFNHGGTAGLLKALPIPDDGAERSTGEK